jgi:hypothetical protein
MDGTLDIRSSYHFASSLFAWREYDRSSQRTFPEFPFALIGPVGPIGVDWLVADCGGGVSADGRDRSYCSGYHGGKLVLGSGESVGVQKYPSHFPNCGDT